MPADFLLPPPLHSDPDLVRLVDQLGPPPEWTREPGFPTLIHIILEQQVSLASALAAFQRLNKIAAPLTPANFLALSDETLRQVGFSRQKTRYGRELAQAVEIGTLDLNALSALDDATVHAQLTQIKGIGSWTANIYLLMCLRRLDVWPVGDLALRVAVGRVKGLAARPTRDEVQAIGEAYRPHRSLATRLFWHHYLSAPKA